MTKNNLVEIVNRNQISSQSHLRFDADYKTYGNVCSYQPSVIFSLDSIKSIYCDMDILLKSNIKDYLEQPDFDPVDSNIEVIWEDGNPIYAQYSYWLKLDDSDETYPLTRCEYQNLRIKLGFDYDVGPKWSTKAKYPTIEELKEYVKEKE